MPRTYNPAPARSRGKRRQTQAIKPLTAKENAALYAFQIGMLMLVLAVFFSLLEAIGTAR